VIARDYDLRKAHGIQEIPRRGKLFFARSLRQIA
jgi:hypothetical protein